jgi:hypothetical protein
VSWPKQHILRLDIAVDKTLIVHILQRARDLQNDRQDTADWECSMLRKILLEIPTRRILHCQERSAPFHTKIEHTHNMPVSQVSKDACLHLETLHVFFACKKVIQEFERHVGVEVVMHAQVDTGIPTLSELADQCIKSSQEKISNIDKCVLLFYIPPMKLCQYAKQQGINYRTALCWFRDVAIQKYQAPSGTIIVTETVNDIRHHLTEYNWHLEEWVGQVGVSEAGRGIRNWVSAQISARSREYAEECKRQLSARHTGAS